MSDPPAGKLLVIGTPIGNLEDLTLRALRTLGEVDALACEDTRHTRRIFERHGIGAPRVVFSCHEHNEERATRKIIQLLEEGLQVGLCTNAGMPSISDPGYDAIAGATEAGFRVEVIPGPSAVETALVVSGLPASSYVFKGFPPRKPGPRKRFLELERDLPHTLVLFESPHRIGRLLADAWEVLGDRRAAVCLELTKLFEQIDRGYLSELTERYAEGTVKGEITVVIAGNHPKFVRQAGAEGSR
ncbi:MAG: 16S rRNA (cytidine(1402)-2'-O)-methyltransferase [Armatimonadetes bacterium]|nr:16S rRNA (cytidine(1402)-2'-O)-methyltransferase [Armatimonadota bacterium]